jgi:glycine zipper 2TM protein
MSPRTSFRAGSIAVIAIVSIALAACGGNPPAQQNAAPPAAAAPATAAPEPAPAAPANPTPVTVPVSKPAAAPAPKPKPKPIVKTLVQGTELDVELLDDASSDGSQVGQAVRAKVVKPVALDGLTVVPEGSIVSGVVTEAIPLKKIGGAASLGIKFSSLEAGGAVPIDASVHFKGKSETGKDAGTIAGATVGGALLGNLVAGKHDKTKGTLIGAVVGAAAGTGAAAATKGKEVQLPAGTPLTLRLEDPADVTVHP